MYHIALIWLLGLLIDQSHFSVQLAVKILRFVNYMLKSFNKLVACVGNVTKYNAESPIGRNVSYCKHKYNVILAYF